MQAFCTLADVVGWKHLLVVITGASTMCLLHAVLISFYMRPVRNFVLGRVRPYIPVLDRVKPYVATYAFGLNRVGRASIV